MDMTRTRCTTEHINSTNKMGDIKVRKAKITDLIQDDRNLNKGTERGKQLIAKSINKFGAVRGIAVDKDNRIIAGNKTVENAIEQGIKDIIIVETTGDELVVTQRTDASLDTREGREMALADNATVKVDLEWDTEQLESIEEDYGIDADDWDVITLDVEVPEDNTYVTTISTPVYEPKEASAPPIDELYDSTKADSLKREIDEKNIPEDVKDFLRLATTRHIVFDYGRIAEYYAHAPADVQRLMEKSALIIIDFDKAIEGGYVRLKEQIRGQMLEDIFDEE